MKERFQNAAAGIMLTCILFIGVGGSLFAGGGKDSGSSGPAQSAPGPFGKYSPPIEVTAVKNLGGGNLKGQKPRSGGQAPQPGPGKEIRRHFRIAPV
jgi:hypothetical protein